MNGSTLELTAVTPHWVVARLKRQAAPVADRKATAADAKTETRPARAEGPARPRLDSVDLLRGIVMAVMVLDHARDFFGGGALNPRDVNDSALFLTRWVTHFCAPVFIFLAGVSAYLYGRRPGRTTRDVGRFLVTRGLWLVLLEVTLVCFGWTFDPRVSFVTLQVIWAIGCSMVVLAGLVHLPRPALVAVALAVILGHNLLDGVRAEQLGSFGRLWVLLHEPGMLIETSRFQLFVLYPLVPWFAVMAAGYALGPVMQYKSRQRRRALIGIGAAAVLLFALWRGFNVYGDPAPWTAGKTALATLLSILNCEKYPPSLMYLAMTLGPALIALALLERATGPLARALTTFGRVPLLFYVAHVYLIHALVVAIVRARGGDAGWLFSGTALMAKPETFSFALPTVYALWLCVLLALYPLCRWFADVKRRRTEWWLSYL